MLSGADFIKTAIADITAVIQKYAPELLAAAERENIHSYEMAFVGQCMDPPQVWVQPGRVQLGTDSQAIEERQTVTITIGVMGGEPEDVVAAAIDYVNAVTLAVLSGQYGVDWDVSIEQVWPVEQDYGPLFHGQQAYVQFPQIHLTVARQEVVQ